MPIHGEAYLALFLLDMAAQAGDPAGVKRCFAAMVADRVSPTSLGRTAYLRALLRAGGGAPEAREEAVRELDRFRREEGGMDRVRSPPA